MKTTKKIDTGDTHIESKMNISASRLITIIWPAVILANKRIIRANGFANIPISSTGTIMGRSQKGTPGVAKMCRQYPFVPLICMIKNVNNARVIVRARFPVTLAPKGGGNGISPIILLIRIKKKTDKR